MIQVGMFRIGQRGDKWHAAFDADGERWEGPPRDTEAEAIADRDQAVRLFQAILSKTMPGAIVTAGKVQ